MLALFMMIRVFSSVLEIRIYGTELKWFKDPRRTIYSAGSSYNTAYYHSADLLLPPSSR